MTSHHGALTPKPRCRPGSGGACGARAATARRGCAAGGGAARSGACRRSGSPPGSRRRTATPSGVPTPHERHHEDGRRAARWPPAADQPKRVVRVVVVDAVDHPVQLAPQPRRAPSGRSRGGSSTRAASSAHPQSTATSHASVDMSMKAGTARAVVAGPKMSAGTAGCTRVRRSSASLRKIGGDARSSAWRDARGSLQGG